MTELHDLAGEAYDHFETKTRDNGERFVAVTDGAPEWLTDLCREAHGGMFPDDWRYDCIHNALGYIHDNEADEDNAGEFADDQVDVYNSARYAWLASHLDRAGYVDEATREFGPTDDITDAIGRGQYMEAQEVYYSVLSFLREHLTELAETVES